MPGFILRVSGLVQGVGFRPTVWRLAHELHLAGTVQNDGAGVLIRIWGTTAHLQAFCTRLPHEMPPLARIDALSIQDDPDSVAPTGFTISASQHSAIHTGIVPDAATCPACLAELFDPTERRYHYPFTNCTHCGPRLTIVRAIPYDRAQTSMAAFTLCPACAADYANPADRRFHAQPIACPVCGPQVWLEDGDGQRLPTADALHTASAWLRAGKIIAIKGIGGFHLACAAADEVAVATLRQRKHRYAKPLALMARDLAVIRRYCAVNAQEATLLQSPAAPVVLLEQHGPATVAPSVAAGQRLLRFMLPYSPLHHLLLADWDTPLVMTSGNLSEQPQCTDNTLARQRLGGIADALLLHDREIVNRVDDSVVQLVAGEPRLLRRARGYAPTPLTLPPGFEQAPALLALGGELKNTFCLLRDGQAILSQHLGDLADARTADDYRRLLTLYAELFQHQPQLRAVDLHPDYLSSKLGRALCAQDGLPLIEVQHHHAHIAACLADNGWPLAAGPVLGVALDGLGYGTDGTLWGGEWLRADYYTYQRLACCKPVPLLGGTQAILEPWRLAFAHLLPLWEQVTTEFGALECVRYLHSKPLATLQAMQARGLNCPLTSSCGRLFDAVAALLGICRERIFYEGQAASELAAVAAAVTEAYPFALSAQQLDPAPLWPALLADLRAGVPVAVCAGRFQAGLATAIVDLSARLAVAQRLNTVALSGGVFQNAALFTAVAHGLQAQGLTVLSQRQIPTNDGGLALGQAVVAAAQRL